MAGRWRASAEQVDHAPIADTRGTVATTATVTPLRGGGEGGSRG